MVKYLAIIPARKNSKRIKNKNLKKIKRRTLFHHTLDAAKRVRNISKIVVTTDIKKLLKKDTKKIIYIKRPKKLSKDSSTTESAISHSLKHLKETKKIIPKNIILLQPTSPYRNSLDIIRSIKKYEKEKYDSLFSAYKDKMLLWEFNKKRFNPINYQINKRKREQETRDLIIENGAIFIFKYEKFLKKKVRLFGRIGCFFMSKKNSIEIDDNFDLRLANRI